MSEKTAINIVNLILIIISAFCIPTFVISNLDMYEEKNCIFALINLGFFGKFYLGMKRYDSKLESGCINKSGLKLLEFSLFRFF
jgi:hypothetical protein